MGAQVSSFFSSLSNMYCSATGAPIDIPTIPDEVVEEHPRFPFHTLAPEKRCDNFDEVVCGYHRLDAMAESLRCLHCDRR